MNQIATNDEQDWDPRSPEVLADPLAAYDRMREQCPVAHSDYLHYSVFRHDDVLRIIEDHDTFSSRASRHLAVPNNMDPPEHTAYRRLIEPYFSAERIAAFEPLCRDLCRERVATLPGDGPAEVMFGLAHPLALRLQCAFLGWPESLHLPLLEWIYRKNAATLTGDSRATAAVAAEFDAVIREQLEARRAAGVNAPDDATTRLLNETVFGRPLSEEEVISILRNWTVGELGTLASSIGILAGYLADHPRLQQQLREQPELVWRANDEILRIHAPLMANRRTPTCPVRLGGRRVLPGQRLTLMWASANRDARAFEAPLTVRLDRDPSKNLLYGAGIHACPGAGLARLELASMVQALLASRAVEKPEVADQQMAVYPASGYQHLVLQWHAL